MPERELVEDVFAGRMLPPKPSHANAGLVFERYLRVWESDEQLTKTRRSELLGQFVAEYGGLKEALSPYLRQVHARQESTLKYVFADAAITEDFETAEYLTSGLGNAHPLENGFFFDHTLGIPCLTGSQIKGLCRSVAHDKREYADDLYGPDELTNENAQVGDIVFLPAYPSTWPELAVDIVNNHQSKYYDGSDANPIENQEPKPVFFLAVAKGVRFTFRVASRSGDKRQVERAYKHLVNGLSLLGIGAKSGLGYGVMVDKTQGQAASKLKPIDSAAQKWLTFAVQAIDRTPLESPPEASVDWLDAFEGTTAMARRIPRELTAWNDRFLPELERERAKLEALGKRIYIKGSMRLPTAFSVGFCLPDHRGFAVQIDQGVEPWNTHAERAHVPLRADEKSLGQGSELAVGLSLSRNVSADVEDYVGRAQLPVQRFVHLWLGRVGNDTVRSNGEARGIGESAIDAVVAQVKATRATKVHLFVSAPLAVALFLGHRWNRLPNTQTYEDGGAALGYVPAFLLPGV